MSNVLFARDPELDVNEFRRILIDSGLGTIRPVDDKERLSAMLLAANLILTARLDHPGRPLIGVARCITDFNWCCYLSELAVTKSAQGLGVGQGLLNAARQHLGPRVSLILISVPEAAGFYEHAGMARVSNAFWHHRER